MSHVNPLDVRNLLGVGWQIYLADAVHWRTCRSELDARYIANGLQLASSIKYGERRGEETAQELDEAAATATRNWGECGVVTTLQRSAANARS
jgi:hypothetical protein